ncbi:unannotated protein [freshwater metagenome]|uniref:Unannotated protein n=1 Tax=freshwater metagenome TaxID=449393 RepID=A0A6J7RPI0_9ZZZZ
MDVEREGVVAPGDVLKAVDDTPVVIGLDVELFAIIGPRMRAGRAELNSLARGEREEATTHRSLARERIPNITAGPGANLNLRKDQL